MRHNRPEEDKGEEVMAGQKINWWDSDARSAPEGLSNVDIYCKLRWNESAKRSAAAIGARGAKGKADVGMNGAGIAPEMAAGGVPMQNANMQMIPGQQGPIQATPVIQPLVVVPYSTPMQPLYHYGDGTLPIGDIDSDFMRMNGGMMPGINPQGPMMPGSPDDIYYNMDEKTEGKVKRARKGVGAVPILVMILIALFGTLQLFFAPLLGLLKVEGLETAFAVVGGDKIELYSAVETVIKIFTGETEFAFTNYALLAQCCLSVAAVLLALSFILSLISITRKKLPLFVRILILLALLFTAGSIVLLAFFVEGATLGLSCYVLGGIMLLIFIISLCGKSNKTKLKSKKRGRGRR